MDDNQKCVTLDGRALSTSIWNQLCAGFAKKSRDTFRSYLFAENCKKAGQEELYNLFLEISNDEKEQALKLLKMANMVFTSGCLFPTLNYAYNYRVYDIKSYSNQLKYVAVDKTSQYTKTYPELVELVLAEKIEMPSYNDKLTEIADYINNMIIIEKQHVEKINKILDTLGPDDTTQ